MTSPGDTSGGLPDPPDFARHLFGDALPTAVAYAELLATDGVSHGHLGPREVPKLWTRHLVNSALLSDLLPQDAVVIDVGSGAGLPGIPMAIRRPDLRMTLLEPMQRRSDFLARAVSSFGLGERVSVVRGRADDAAIVAQLGSHDWVVARAVAPLDRLVRWCLPLLKPRGRLLALKGSSAAAEIDEHRDAILRLGGLSPTVVEVGGGSGDSTWVVSVQRRAPRVRPASRTARRPR